MRHAPDVLTNAVADALVVEWDAFVGFGVVGVDGRAIGCTLSDELL